MDIRKKPLSVGLLAHVDAGKTTLSEALLYCSGAKRSLGRVDHRDAFLDTHELERARGITIFSKQAVFSIGDTQAGHHAVEKELPFDAVSAITVLGRNKLNIYHGENIYQLKGGKRFNALKYVHIYHRSKNIVRGEANEQFLGL